MNTNVVRVACALSCGSCLAACSGRAIDLDRPMPAADAGVAVPAGVEVVLANEAAVELTVGPDRLYWRTDEYGKSRLRGCNKDACASSVMAYTPLDASDWNTVAQAHHIGASLEHVLFEAPPGVYSCPLTGCAPAPTRVFQDLYHRSPPTYDGDDIYWSSTFDVYRCSAAGCGETPEVVAYGAGSFLPLAFEGDDVYWLEDGIRRAPKDGSRPALTIVHFLDIKPAPYATQLTLDTANIYWVDESAHILSCPIAGCDASDAKVLVATDAGKQALFVDATGLYWLESPDPYSVVTTLRHCALTGCEQSTALSQNPVLDFAVDDQFVYFSEETQDSANNSIAGNIYRAPKPQP